MFCNHIYSSSFSCIWRTSKDEVNLSRVCSKQARLHQMISHSVFPGFCSAQVCLWCSPRRWCLEAANHATDRLEILCVSSLKIEKEGRLWLGQIARPAESNSSPQWTLDTWMLFWSGVYHGMLVVDQSLGLGMMSMIMILIIIIFYYCPYVLVVVVSLLIQLNPRAQNVSRPWKEPYRRYKSELR